jgi:hypothetical protein
MRVFFVILEPASVWLRECVCPHHVHGGVSDVTFFEDVTGCGQRPRVQGIGIESALNGLDARRFLLEFTPILLDQNQQLLY